MLPELRTNPGYLVALCFITFVLLVAGLSFFVGEVEASWTRASYHKSQHAIESPLTPVVSPVAPLHVIPQATAGGPTDVRPWSKNSNLSAPWSRSRAASFPSGKAS